MTTQCCDNLFRRDFPSPAQYFRFRARRFRFLDVAVAIVEKRKARPADLVVRLQFSRFLPGFDRFGKAPDLHQRHAERMPSIEKCRIKLHARAIFLDRAFEFANGEIAIGIVKKFVARFHSLGQTPQTCSEHGVVRSDYV